MKYNVRYDWKDNIGEHKYRVTTSGIAGTKATIVKDRSPQLYPQFYDKECCWMYDTGNGYKISFDSNKFIELDYVEAMNLLTALLVEYNRDYKIKVKEKV